MTSKYLTLVVIMFCLEMDLIVYPSIVKPLRTIVKALKMGRNDVRCISLTARNLSFANKVFNQHSQI